MESLHGALGNDQQRLAIRSRLRSVVILLGQMFAAGDCADFIRGQHVPKAGVYAVHQGPVLSTTLRAVIPGQGTLGPYRIVLVRSFHEIVRHRSLSHGARPTKACRRFEV